MSAVVGGLSDTLETLASEVGELEERAEELQGELDQANDRIGQLEERLEDARSREVTDEEWVALHSYTAVYDKLADVQRGIATLDEVFEEAGLA
jgi:chromosome segregation ATPase